MLDKNGSDAASDRFVNFERFVKRGSGTWTLTGISIDDFANGLEIEDGLLNVWQNDVPTATVVIGSSTWETLIANSKFADWQGFGTATTGNSRPLL